MADRPGYWDPPRRSTATGHRVARRVGYRPIETRRLGWRAWLAEHVMRMLARSMAMTSADRYFAEEPDPDYCEYGCMPMDHGEESS